MRISGDDLKISMGYCEYKINENCGNLWGAGDEDRPKVME